MAVKSSLTFPLSFFLLVSQMAIAPLGAVDNAACEPVYAPPYNVSTPPPVSPPVHAPPHYVSTPPPTSPPVSTPSPPVSAPPVNSPPVSTPPATPSPPLSAPPSASVPPSVVGLHGCGGMCSKHCRLARPFRLCMRACGECCNKSLCVPSLMKCDNWPVSVVIHGKTVNCP